jgi:cysteine desulfuration protein SufE
MPVVPTVPDVDQVREDFEFLEEWEDRFGYVIDLGKRLPPMPPGSQNDGTKVTGCQASVWLMTQRADDGTLTIRAMSDAHIVNGLIAILLSLYDGKTPAEVLATDAETFFRELGLEEHLSPTRRNGLHSMIGRVRDLASAAA